MVWGDCPRRLDLTEVVLRHADVLRSCGVSLEPRMVTERGDASAAARVTGQSIYTLAVLLVHDCAANVLEDDPLMALIACHSRPHRVQRTSVLPRVW